MKWFWPYAWYRGKMDILNENFTEIDKNLETLARSDRNIALIIDKFLKRIAALESEVASLKSSQREPLDLGIITSEEKK